MRIAIHHETTYRYDRPVIGGIQYLRLTPLASPAQDVLAWKIRAPGRLTAWTDEYGNLCHSVTMLGLQEAITVVAEGQVETQETHGILPQDEVGSLPVSAYLRQTPLTALDAPLEDFAESHREALAADPLDGLHRLMTAITQAVAYREGATEVGTTAAEAFASGHGVCQDHAHVFAGCARYLGVPVRYVSGYLASPSEGAALHTASHAWAEALVRDLGWVSFDPANGTSANEHYVRVAVGLDYGKAAPLRGVRHGGEGEALEVQVRIQGQG